MLEPELVRGSERRARPDRGLAVGLQRGAATQLAGVSDPGRVRPPSSRAPVAYGSLRAAARPGPSFVGARRPPGSYIMTGPETGGRSLGVAANDRSGEASLVLTGTASGGLIANDSYLFGGYVANAPTN